VVEMQTGFNPIKYLLEGFERSKERDRVLELKVNEICERLNILMEHLDGSRMSHSLTTSTTFTAQKVDLIDDGTVE
jgi:hypothetical protein